MAEAAPPPRWRWYHALIFWILVMLSQYTGLGAVPDGYASLRQAPFAPPAWVFTPVWLLLNLSVLWGNLRLLNARELRYRHTLVALQGLSWLIYATFCFVNFQLKSPVLAFDWTFLMFLLTGVSLMLVWKSDRKIAFSLLPLLLWLAFALVLASYQVMYNPDPFFGKGMLQR